MKKSDSRNYRVKLLEEMKSGIFADCERLPRETELAEMLGISRTQLRDALSELEREGYITRRHGVGTLINRHVLQVSNRMDIETEFLDIVRNCGYAPEIRCEAVWEDTAGEKVAAKLQIPEGSRIVCKRSVCTADGRPALCWTDILAVDCICEPWTHEDFQNVIFTFLQEFCHVSAYMDLSELHAVAADEITAAALSVPVGTPLLNMKETDFDVEGNPVFYSDQYFVDGVICQTVLRKKL